VTTSTRIPPPSPSRLTGSLDDFRGDPISLGRRSDQRLTLFERVERYISRLSTRNRFWQKVCSLIWLPYAFRSGITMKRLDSRRFRAVLPFRRINRNWYNAMAGAALLGNSEVAAGLYLFGECGSEYIVVCKELRYRFLRPCLGPAVYEVVNTEDLDEKLATGEEFNIDLELEISQQLKKKGRTKRVGRCFVTFHCTPKSALKGTEARGGRDRGTKGQRDRVDGAQRSLVPEQEP
jgi:hypothetical protein